MVAMFNGRAKIRAQIRTLFSLLPLSILLACSALNSNSKTTEANAKIRQLERELRKRQVAIDDLKERNLVLEGRLGALRKAEATARPPMPQAVSQQQQQPQPQQQQQMIAQQQQSQIAPPAIPAAAAPSATAAARLAVLPPHLSSPKTPAQTAAEAKPEEILQTDEQRLYSKVLESYRVHNTAELQKAVEILLKTYPDSIYADNALYLAGLLAFESNDLTRSGAFMDRVLREYPKGNKAVSALFAKAMIEKRGHKYKEAKSLLETIRKLYPGSPEALRVGIEVKIIDLAAASDKSKES